MLKKLFGFHDITVTGDMTVAEWQHRFEESFGTQIRVYKPTNAGRINTGRGSRPAEQDSALAAIPPKLRTPPGQGGQGEAFMVWNRIRMRREPNGPDFREIIYILAAVVCGGFAVLPLTAESGAGFGKLACLLAMPFTIGASYAGARIADVLRRIARPDAIAVKGKMAEILAIKLYWHIGVQLIGAALGAGVMMWLIMEVCQ